MKTLARLALLVALVLGFSAVASAQYQPQLQKKKFGTLVAGSTDRYQVLTQVASTAAASARTFTLDVRTFSKLSVLVDLNGYGAGTAITLTCSWSLDRGTTWTRVMSTSVATGAGSVSAYTDTYPSPPATISAAAAAGFEYDVRTYDSFKCVVGITGGNGSDVFDVYATASSGV